MENRILCLLNSKAFQELKSFYEETTIFNVIGAERSETRHSAFLSWLFSPDSSHGLGTEPLKLFLRLVATLKWGRQIFDGSLYTKVLAGNYELELLEPIELEKNVGKLSDGKGQDKDRIDVWMVAGLTYEDNGEIRQKAFPIVIENKIYAKEGGPKKGSALWQTERYYNAMNDYCAAQQKSPDIIYKPIGVMLSPKETDTAHSEQFTNLTYQQLLKYVLEPVATMAMQDADKEFINAYIRNLSKPSVSGTHVYSVLAISEQERELINKLYEVDEDLFQQALIATYGNQAKSILGKDIFIQLEDSIGENAVLLRELWDGNEDIFRAVIYQQFPDQAKTLEKLFKTSNRDSSKYRVYFGEDEIFPDRRLSKSMAACAIFKAYLKQYPETTLENLQKAFPCIDINEYYYDNYYKELFYLYDDNCVDEQGEIALSFTADKRMNVPSLAKWDFYLNDAQLLPIKNGTEKAMCVKMWRKGDFDRLIDYVQKKDYSSFITIEECL
jgi:hypothetical protein